MEQRLPTDVDRELVTYQQVGHSSPIDQSLEKARFSGSRGGVQSVE